MFTIRYFSFDDPVTGKTTKGYGYSASSAAQNTVIKNVQGASRVLKNQTVEQTRESVPKFSNVKELSEEEFNALDVSGESLLSQLTREKNSLKLKKIQARREKPVLSSDELVKVFEKLA